MKNKYILAQNGTASNLTVESIDISNQYWTVVQPLPLIVEAGGQQKVELLFDGSNAPAGEVVTTFTINFSNGDSHQSTITLQNDEALNPELVVNGDFSDNTNSWVAQNALLSIENAINGVDGVLAVADNGGWTQAKQAISTVAGEWYDILVYRYAPVSTSNGQLQIYDGDVTGALVEVVGDVFAEPLRTESLGDWHYITYRFQAKSATTTITLNSNSTNTAYYKHVSVRKSSITSPLIYAHRGFASMRPENTIASFTFAAQQPNVYAIELDASITKDGYVVVFHDTTLDRTTNGTGSVSDYTLAELQALDAGSWFSEAFAGEKIPLLTDVLDIAKTYNVNVAIETKNMRSTYDIQKVVAIASQYPNVTVTWNSFDPAEMLVTKFFGGCGDIFLNTNLIDNELYQAAAEGKKSGIEGFFINHTLTSRNNDAAAVKVNNLIPCFWNVLNDNYHESYQNGAYRVAMNEPYDPDQIFLNYSFSSTSSWGAVDSTISTSNYNLIVTKDLDGGYVYQTHDLTAGTYEVVVHLSSTTGGAFIFYDDGTHNEIATSTTVGDISAQFTLSVDTAGVRIGFGEVTTGGTSRFAYASLKKVV